MHAFSFSTILADEITNTRLVYTDLATMSFIETKVTCFGHIAWFMPKR